MARPSALSVPVLRSSLLALTLVSVMGAGAGCRPEPEPIIDPLRYLRIGADFRGEASTFAARLRREGWTIERRQDGRTFAAISARREEQALVRVWTRRGLMVTIDAPSPEHWRRDILLAPPTEATDLDGDGHEELVIGATDDAMGRTCFAVVRVDDEGFTREVTPHYEELGGNPCVEGFTETAGRLRAMVVVRFARLGRVSVPSVLVPHAFDAEEGEWRPRLDADFLDRERQARTRALERGAIDAHRGAVELAALAHLAGEDTGAQLAAFDAALGAEVGAVSAEVRARIARGWRDEEEAERGGEEEAGEEPEDDPVPAEPR